MAYYYDKETKTFRSAPSPEKSPKAKRRKKTFVEKFAEKAKREKKEGKPTRFKDL